MPESDTNNISMLLKETEVNMKRTNSRVNSDCLREGGTRKEARHFGDYVILYVQM